MEYIIPIAGFVFFCLYAFKRYSGGRFSTSKYTGNTLYVLLFILPIIQAVLCCWYAKDLYTNSGNLNVEALFLFAAPIILLVLNIVFLRERKLSDIVFIIYTLVLSAFIAVVTIKIFFVEIQWGWFLMSESDRYAGGLTNILILVILQTLHIHWLKSYYNVERVGAENATIHTFDAIDNTESRNTQKNESDVTSKKEDLYELKRLLDNGVLTKDEFEIEKQKILRR